MEDRIVAEPKPIASLSSGLLARKGQAAPAMRRQGMMALVSDKDADIEQSQLEDLGWNDMGLDHVTAHSGLSPMAPTPAAAVVAQSLHYVEEVAVPEVVRQQQDLARDIVAQPRPAIVAPRAEPKVRAEPGARGKAAFTLRLDTERHLKLRLVCAVNHRSAQQIVTQALDAFLASQPIAAELNALQPMPHVKN
jgi:hypothetical protein